MVYQFYYDLRNEKSLPPGSRFLDPFDHSPFLPVQGETLQEFISRIVDSREEKKYPKIKDEELRRFVVDSLMATTPAKLADQYFERKQTLPSASQLLSFSRSTVEQIFKGNKISPYKRQTRAKHCLGGCRFHVGGIKWTEKFTDFVSSLIGIEKATVSDAEKAVGILLMS